MLSVPLHEQAEVQEKFSLSSQPTSLGVRAKLVTAYKTEKVGNMHQPQLHQLLPSDLTNGMNYLSVGFY